MIKQLAEYLTILAALAGAVVYAENEYAKDSTIQNQFQQLQVDRWQERIDILSNKKEHAGLTTEQRWELRYYTDKRNNFLKSTGK